MDLSDLMAQDTEGKTVHVPNDVELKSVADLANEQLRLERLLAQQEEVLSEIRRDLTKVRECDLPNALEAIGLSTFTLKDNSTISIKEEVYAGITEENREPAYQWLEKTGNDGIIKNEVKCPFGKGQDAEARRLMDVLTQQGYSFTNSRSVHPQTLRAFVRHQMEDGAPIPTDVFSIHVKKVATIKLPKEK